MPLDKGREIVQREVDCMRACGKPSKNQGQLILSLIKIEIRQGHVDRAECLINELLGIYS
jgi:hypothetical protein